MAELKGSKTEQNLQAAFAGESQARNKYTYFASAARKEGYERIAAIFLETAEQEKEHAKLHLKLLQGIGDTRANLKAAAGGENEEWTLMYPGMAETAREEGFEEIAVLFDHLATHREGARGALRQAAEALRGGHDLLTPEGGEVALPQLRSRGRGDRAAPAVPGLQAPAGILRGGAGGGLSTRPRGAPRTGPSTQCGRAWACSRGLHP